MTEQEAIHLQQELKVRVIFEDLLPPKLKYIAGVDVGYATNSDTVVAAMAVMDMETFNIKEIVTTEAEVEFPYIPGLFSFREMPSLLKVLQQTAIDPDVIVCDGHGLSHPRRFGLACHLGVVTGIPTIGCAKTRLIGEYRESGPARGDFSDLVDNNEVIGRVLKTQDNLKPVFVSVGHKVSLQTACDLVLQLCSKYRLPDVIREADHAGRMILKKAEIE